MSYVKLGRAQMAGQSWLRGIQNSSDGWAELNSSDGWAELIP